MIQSFGIAKRVECGDMSPLLAYFLETKSGDMSPHSKGCRHFK
jgi:hypothetical protein